MKKHCLSFSIFAAICTLVAHGADKMTNEWGAVSCNAQMSIRMKGASTDIRINQPFSLTIRLRNLSTNETFYFHCPSGTRIDAHFSYVTGLPTGEAVRVQSGLTFAISSPSGKDIAPVGILDPRDLGRIDNVSPGQLWESDFNVGSLCKFNEIGTYKITASQDVGNVTQETCIVVSNPLYVVVSPGEWKSTDSPTNGTPKIPDGSGKSTNSYNGPGIGNGLPQF